MLIGVLACSDDFTDIPAVGALSDEALLNETGVNLLLTGAYSLLDGVRNNQGASDWVTSGDNWWFDVLSDDAHKGSTDGDQSALYALEVYNWTSGNSYVLAKWRALYAGVNRANAAINLIGKIDEGDFSAQLAEARFLRAHFNFELSKIWENVAFISSENHLDNDFNQPNSTNIWVQVEDDLNYAIENLPATQAEVGRPTSWTAKAFLGKAKVFQKSFGPALVIFKDIITSGPYSLINEFGNNFRYAGDNSSESIFAIQFTPDSKNSLNGNRGYILNYPVGTPQDCCGFLQPTQDLVNAYQTDASGLPLLDTFNAPGNDVANDYGITSADSFTPHTGTLDPRLDYTVGRRGLDWNGYGMMVGKDRIRANFSDISGPYLSKKFIIYNGETENIGTGSWGQINSGVNYHIMRYADLLLLAAEAAAETNEIATALSYVNMIRNRAKTSTYQEAIDSDGNLLGVDAANYLIEPYASFTDQEHALKAVRFERRLELAMEGHRLFDVNRYNDGADIMNSYFSNESRVITSFSGKSSPYVSGKHNRFPIPLTAIDLSENILTQNPNY